MNAYTEPTLLDVVGATEALPDLSPSGEGQVDAGQATQQRPPRRPARGELVAEDAAEAKRADRVDHSHPASGSDLPRAILLAMKDLRERLLLGLCGLGGSPSDGQNGNQPPVLRHT